MSNLVLSLSMYLIAANLVAGTIYIFGQKKVGLLAIEYPFIYTPWIILQLIAPGFVEIPGVADTDLSLKYFLILLQGFSCGVLGGMILLPRFFYPAETTREKLKITMISTVVFGIIYFVSRMLLLEMLTLLLT